MVRAVNINSSPCQIQQQNTKSHARGRITGEDGRTKDNDNDNDNDNGECKIMDRENYNAFLFVVPLQSVTI